MPDKNVFVVSTNLTWADPLRAIGPRQLQNELRATGYRVHEIPFPMADMGRICGAFDAAALVPFSHAGDLLVGFGVGAAIFDHPTRLLVVDPEAEAPGLEHLEKEAITLLRLRMRSVTRLVTVGEDVSGLSPLNVEGLEPTLVLSSTALIVEVERALR